MLSALKQTFRSACIAFLALAILFMTVEPRVSKGATSGTSQFTVSLAISNELAFVTPASNISLSPALGGLTGGTANGVTQVVVRSASLSGYSMTLAASSSVGMIGIASSSNSIPAYVPSSTGVPDYNFNTPSNTARFGYTAEASTTSDLAQIFLDNGASCNTSTGDSSDHCWLNASTTAVTIVNRSSPTPSNGATTTLKFRAVISANPSPVIPDDTYVATTTLTATSN